MGGSTSKPTPQPQPPSPQPPPPQPQRRPAPTAPTSSYSFSQPSTTTNTWVTVPSIISANILVAHPANDYKIPNVEINNDSRPSFTLPLNSIYNRRNNLKIERFVMRICPQYLSRKGCCIQYCYRFHVCQFWIKGNCNRDKCEFDHGF
ncbi:hypothetical protein Avbf_12119 [Armadillidium vulgare]|nr:hypothetical protein Avbf_12119 [Armadillidium vulgare]